MLEPARPRSSTRRRRQSCLARGNGAVEQRAWSESRKTPRGPWCIPRPPRTLIRPPVCIYRQYLSFLEIYFYVWRGIVARSPRVAPLDRRAGVYAFRTTSTPASMPISIPTSTRASQAASFCTKLLQVIPSHAVACAGLWRLRRQVLDQAQQEREATIHLRIAQLSHQAYDARPGRGRSRRVGFGGTQGARKARHKVGKHRIRRHGSKPLDTLGHADDHVIRQGALEQPDQGEDLRKLLQAPRP